MLQPTTIHRESIGLAVQVNDHQFLIPKDIHDPSVHVELDHAYPATNPESRPLTRHNDPLLPSRRTRSAPQHKTPVTSGDGGLVLSLGYFK